MVFAQFQGQQFRIGEIHAIPFNDDVVYRGLLSICVIWLQKGQPRCLSCYDLIINHVMFPMCWFHVGTAMYMVA